MATQYEFYLQVKGERETAEAWNNLPKGPKYQSDTLGISVAHCSIQLTRAGQQRESGKNYWETAPSFNRALLATVAAHPEIIEEAIERLRIKEREALARCREFAQGILDEIEAE